MSRLMPRLALTGAVTLVALGGAIAPALAESTVAGSTTPAVAIEVPSPGTKPLLAETFPNDLGATSAIVRWSAPPDAIAGYRIVSPEGERDEPSTATQLNLRRLQPDTAYEVRVQSRLADGSLSEALVIAFRTLPIPAPVTYDYGVTGSAELPTLVRGSLPLKGAAALTFGNPTGDVRPVVGTLALGQASGRLVASGAIPVTAKISFVSSGPATGGFGGFAGSLWLNQKVRIKVLEAKLFGAVPLAGGNACQTKQLTDLNLNSRPPFSRATGGVLTGTFKMGDLNGCGVLNGLVSPATASDANTISVTLAPAA